MLSKNRSEIFQISLFQFCSSYISVDCINYNNSKLNLLKIFIFVANMIRYLIFCSLDPVTTMTLDTGHIGSLTGRFILVPDKNILDVLKSYAVSCKLADRWRITVGNMYGLSSLWYFLPLTCGLLCYSATTFHCKT